MILVVSRDQLLYIPITWSTAVYHEIYATPCYRVEYANSGRINANILFVIPSQDLPVLYLMGLCVAITI